MKTNKIKYIFLFLLLSLLLIPSTLAFYVEPQEIDINANSKEAYLSISYPKINEYDYGENLSFEFVVFCERALVCPDGACKFWLKDTEGNTVQHNTLITFSAGTETYDVTVNTSILNSLGEYSYTFQCEGAEKAGWVSSGFEIINSTTTTTEETQEGGILILLSLLPFLFTIALFFACSFMGEEHSPLKFFTLLLIPIGFWSSMHFATITLAEYYSFLPMLEVVGTTMYWTGWLFFIIVSYLLLFLIYKMVVSHKEKNKENLEY